MSPFEQEVTDALREASREWARAAYMEGDFPSAYMEGDFPRWLAPRVAAAIDAARTQQRPYAYPSDKVPAGERRRAAALAALRGVTTGEEP